MLSISQSPEFQSAVPQFVGAYIEAQVCNAPTSPALWEEIETACAELSQRLTPESLKTQSAIAATRAAYKACGKDPSRYRPASEQLARRALQGKGLYSVDTLVDVGNLVSLLSGYPTGLLDADKIEGEVHLGIGTANDEYEGIGRGALNVQGLPLYRDARGGIATPTSDSTRTMLSSTTQHLLFIINGYDGDRVALQTALEQALALLTRYAAMGEYRVHWF